jgi:hypothetical protein
VPAEHSDARLASSMMVRMRSLRRSCVRPTTKSYAHTCPGYSGRSRMHDPFMIHRPPGVSQQGRHPAIAVATILLRQRDDVFRQRLFVICPARHLALRRSMLAQHSADPSLGHQKLSLHMIDTASSPRRAPKFSRSASCKISLSSVRSEIARRSRRFSFSRSFIRRAWSVFRPPYSLRQR